MEDLQKSDRGEEINPTGTWQNAQGVAQHQTYCIDHSSCIDKKFKNLYKSCINEENKQKNFFISQGKLSKTSDPY